MEGQVTAQHGYAVDQGYVTPADNSGGLQPSQTSESMEASAISHDAENTTGETQAHASSSVEIPAQVEDPEVLTEEDRLWGIVKANPADFTAWTALIQEVDKLDVLENIHKVYDTFLLEYPLCYGYWKKYADHEVRLGSHESTIAVYERAVQAVTYSVDIWTHYCSYLINKQEDPDDIRRLFERGLSYVGTDYLSHILWDKYVDFEVSLNETNRVSQIYTRIIQIPIQQLDRYYHGYKQFISQHTLDELLTPDEKAARPVASSMSSVAEDEELAKFNQIRDEMYKAAKDQDSRIVEFESAIRRPYFHVKPLDDTQLANWHRYLDFIEKEGDFSKVVKIYERCLIACANYPEYWIRYALHMDNEGSMEYAVDALSRATQVFVKRRPEIHLFAARFKEDHGDTDGARLEFEFVNTTLAPGLLQGIVKAANFEHRQGNTDGACAIYTHAIEYEKSKSESRSLPLLFIQYARFLDQVTMNTEKARDVYVDALTSLPLSKTLWEALIHFEAYRSGPRDMDNLDLRIEQVVSASKTDVPAMNPIDREEISSIYLEFLDLYGDLQRIKKAEARHLQLFPLRRSASEGRKRPPSDVVASERSKVLKGSAGSTASPTQVSGVANANGQTQWVAAYGQQGYNPAQGWQQSTSQQAPQVQPQQWNPAYGTQQAAYNPYGGSYGAYVPPQQQALASTQPPAATAYGTYPQSYPPQAFPQQQSYSQQPTYGQQQAQTQQGYYAAYY